MDIFKKVRKNIICKKKNLYLDFTASGLAYKPIEKKILDFLKTYANTHSEYGEHAQKTSKIYQESWEKLYEFLEVDKKNFYILPAGSGSTGAIKKFQEIAGIYLPPNTKKRLDTKKIKKPLVILGPYEHHSNEISYRKSFADVEKVPLKNGEIDLDFLENILKKNKNREKYACFSACSNVTGVITPIEKISKIAKKYKCFLCIDSASYSPYGNIKSNLYDVAFLSPHKLIGGVGSCGILIISKKFFKDYGEPTFSGGGVVDYVSDTKCEYVKNIEERENAGTPAIVQLIRASLAYELRNQIGLENIKKKEEELKKYFYKKAKGFEDFILYEERNKKRVCIFSFNIKNLDHHLISEKLSDDFNIQTRSGCSCAGPYGHYLLNLPKDFDYKKEKKPGWVRVGFFYIHTKKDIDYFFKSLKKVVKDLKNKNML